MATIKDVVGTVVTKRSNQSEDLIGPSKVGRALFEALIGNKNPSTDTPKATKKTKKPRRTEEQKEEDRLRRYLGRQAHSAHQFEVRNHGAIRANGIESTLFTETLERLIGEDE